MNKLIDNWTIGSDIEVFVQNRKTKEVISAEQYIKGTKYEPFNFDPLNKYFAISLDNVLAEFCIPPSKTAEEFLSFIDKSRGYIDSILPKRLCTVALPAAKLAYKWLQTPIAQLFGCEPDINVWLRQVNEPPAATESNLRSAGFHIHIGYDNPQDEVNEKLIKAMDLFVGVPSVLQEPDNDRKKLYGKAGSFRVKDYGAEYRVPSNYLLQDKKLTKWVFGATVRAIGFVNDGRADELDTSGDLIQAAINESDKIKAQNLINQFEIELA